MSDAIFRFFIYLSELLALTLGTVALCGLSVQLCSRLFTRLSGGTSGAFFDITSIVGTPVHELGHAVMCPLFGHKIQSMKLWSPDAKNGTYGYVEHSYNRRNPWARLGNLFIGIGPIFSGLGAVTLTMWLCFPPQWDAYLASTRALAVRGGSFRELTDGLFLLFRSIPGAIRNDWLRSILGLLIILPVSLHITLSWQDLRSSMSALPLYLLMLAVFALVTSDAGVSKTILDILLLSNLRMLSLFSIVIAFSAVWVVLALLWRGIRIFVSWF